MENLRDLFGVCDDCHPVHYLSATQIRNILLLVAVNQACEKNVRLLDCMFSSKLSSSSLNSFCFDFRS